MEYKITLDKDTAKANDGVITATITAPDGYYGHSVLVLLENNDGTPNRVSYFIDTRNRITKRDFKTSLTAQVEFKSSEATRGYVYVMDSNDGTSGDRAYFTFTS